MWYRVALIAMLVGGTGGGVAGAAKHGQAAPMSSATAIDPKADALLHQMSDYLSSLNTFRVDTVTIDETKVGPDGQKFQQLAESKMTIQRPGEMRIDRVSANGRVMLRDDGRQFSVVNFDKNIYATAASPCNLDQAADFARAQLQVDAPGVDLMASHPYEALTEGMTQARYLGLVPMGNGVMAHHLAVTKKEVTYQIWIQDGPQPLPLRYVVTGRNMTAAPQFTIVLRNWQPNAQVPDGTFAFAPPAGARQVAFAPPRRG
jgi:hypothetical protein